MIIVPPYITKHRSRHAAPLTQGSTLAVFTDGKAVFPVEAQNGNG
jgi:hypothetical protein